MLGLCYTLSAYLSIYLSIYIWLTATRCASWGGGVLTANKICSKYFVLSLCVCFHNWSISQWKWVPNLELLVPYLFLGVKHAMEFDSWKWACSRWMLLMLSLTYMTNQKITSVTDLYRGDIVLHSAYKIDYHNNNKLELEALKCPSINVMCVKMFHDQHP